MNQIMATAASIGPDSHVLDAGCGVGGSAMWLAEHLGTHVQGLTISTDQSIRARRYVRQRSLDHLVEVSQGDFLHTEYSDGSFDVAWAQESLVHEPDKRAFFAEIHRVLKPGGRLVIEDWFAERPAVTNREIKVLDAWTAGCAVSPLISVEHLLNIARPSGFRVVEQINLEPFVRRSVMRLFQTSLLLYPLMFVLYKRGIRSPAQHKHLLGAFHAHEAFYRNLWSVHLIVLEKP
jgi:cyclopropane fatty-acyl-phospholipid synthase-like methyltransferase